MENMHGHSRNWFPKNNYTSSSMPQPPMEDKRGIYRPPNGRSFHGRSDNTWAGFNGRGRRQSDFVKLSTISYGDSGSRVIQTSSSSSKSEVETPLSNDKGELSLPNAPQMAVYRPPKGRLFGGENENSLKTMQCSTKKPSDRSAPTPDLVDMSPSLGNPGLVDDDCTSGVVQSPSDSSSYKGKSCTSSAKYKNDDRHSSMRLSEIFGKSCKIDKSFDITDLGIQHEQPAQSRSEKLDVPYSICYPKNPKNLIELKTYLLLNDCDKRTEMNLGVGSHNIRILKPGMVLLRHYLPIADQIEIVESCCKLGWGPGGFYQPGIKQNLKMMCLGKDWDPQTSGYSVVRSTDGAKPPSIPDEFCRLVERAIQESQSYSKMNAEEILPSMTPDICIVNFYTQSGGLGLHQDKDENREYILRGFPVVSFSIGDSAEFVYGDQRDIDNKGEKVVLESGDVLICRGSSREVFRGIKSINRGTAPPALLEGSNLRPGLLNLTFRPY